MIRVYVYVEGQTEETFVRDVLQPAYSSMQIFFTPILAQTSKGHKGGIVNFQKTRRQLERLCLRDKNAYVTTMIDYYGLPADFPGVSSIAGAFGSDIYQNIERLERKLERELQQSNFIANYQLHEYEALLFTEPETFAVWFDNIPLAGLQGVKAEFDTPEHINNSPHTAPSKRISDLAPQYNKVLHGPLIAADIGLGAIRKQCQHFNRWLERIEQLNANGT